MTIITGLVDTVSIPMLLKTVQSNRLDLKQLITQIIDAERRGPQ